MVVVSVTVTAGVVVGGGAVVGAVVMVVGMSFRRHGVGCCCSGGRAFR